MSKVAGGHQIRELRAQGWASFVDLMLMAHADDLELFGVDREKFAAQLRSELSNPLFRFVQALGKITQRFLVAEGEGAL